MPGIPGRYPRRFRLLCLPVVATKSDSDTPRYADSPSPIQYSFVALRLFDPLAVFWLTAGQECRRSEKKVGDAEKTLQPEKLH